MTDITNTNLEAAFIDQKVAGLFAHTRYAFVATIAPTGYGLGVAIADEPGYCPLAGKTFKTYDEAKVWADSLNEHIGLSQDAALDIVGSTMFKRIKRIKRP